MKLNSSSFLLTSFLTRKWTVGQENGAKRARRRLHAGNTSIRQFFHHETAQKHKQYGYTATSASQQESSIGVSTILNKNYILWHRTRAQTLWQTPRKKKIFVIIKKELSVHCYYNIFHRFRSADPRIEKKCLL